MKVLLLLAQRARKDGRWQDSVWEEMWSEIWRTSILFGTLVEYIPMTAKDKSRIHQFGKRNLKKHILVLCATCGEQVGQETWWWQTVKICKNQKPQTSTSKDSKAKNIFVKGENDFPRANGIFRLSHRPRPSSIAEGRRWCWNRRRRQKRNTNRRFVVYERRISFSRSPR